jgi:hypothetical protein
MAMAKPITPRPPETKFLFVHNDAESAVQKKSVVGSSARSHIMNEFKRKEKVAGLVWLKKNSSSVDSFLGKRSAKSDQVGTATLSNSSSRKACIPFRPGPRRAQSLKIWASSEEEFGSESQLHIEDPSKVLQREQNHEPAPAVIFLNGGADDPFSSASIRLDPWMHGLIRYFVGVCMPTLFAVQSVDQDSFRQSSGILDDVINALSDASHMNALLAMSAAHMEVQKGCDRTSTDSHVKGSYHFKGKALHMLQKRLSNDINDVDYEMMQAIMKLSATESILGDYQAQLVHIRAWCRIVSILGGMRKLDWRIVESDVTQSLKIKASGPLLDITLHQDWTPFEIPEARKSSVFPPVTSAIHIIGRRLIDLDRSTDIFQSAFLILLRDIRSLVYMSVFVASNSREVVPADYQWLRESTLGVAHRLCTFPLNYPRLRPYPRCSIQWSVRVTMLLYADSTLINQVPRSALVPELRQALGISMLDAFWSPWTDILLWVLCIGLYSAEGMPDERWFVSQIARVAEFLQLFHWEEVAPILREFFYLDRVHGDPLRRLWGKVELQFPEQSLAT